MAAMSQDDEAARPGNEADAGWREPSVAALLDRYRAADQGGPDAATAARLRRRLDTAWDADATGRADGQVGTDPSQWSGTGARWLLAGGGLTAVTLAWLLWAPIATVERAASTPTSPTSPEGAAASEAPASPAAPARELVADRAPVAAAPAAPALDGEVAASPALLGVVAPPEPVADATPAEVAARAAASPAPRRGDDLSAEVAILARARVALDAGDTTTAVRLARHHRRRFGAGQLREEAQAIEILALAREGRSAIAARLAQAFARTWPRSVHLEAVQRAVAVTP